MVQELEGRQLISKQNKTLEKKKNHQKPKQKETEKRGPDWVIRQLGSSVSVASMVRKGCWE